MKLDEITFKAIREKWKTRHPEQGTCGLYGEMC